MNIKLIWWNKYNIFIYILYTFYKTVIQVDMGIECVCPPLHKLYIKKVKLWHRNKGRPQSSDSSCLERLGRKCHPEGSQIHLWDKNVRLQENTYRKTQRKTSRKIPEGTYLWCSHTRTNNMYAGAQWGWLSGLPHMLWTSDPDEFRIQKNAGDCVSKTSLTFLPRHFKRNYVREQITTVSSFFLSCEQFNSNAFSNRGLLIILKCLE